jgi:hypothetical protein
MKEQGWTRRETRFALARSEGLAICTSLQVVAGIRPAIVPAIRESTCDRCQRAGVADGVDSFCRPVTVSSEMAGWVRDRIGARLGWQHERRQGRVTGRDATVRYDAAG